MALTGSLLKQGYTPLNGGSLPQNAETLTIRAPRNRRPPSAVRGRERRTAGGGQAAPGFRERQLVARENDLAINDLTLAVLRTTRNAPRDLRARRGRPGGGSCRSG